MAGKWQHPLKSTAKPTAPSCWASRLPDEGHLWGRIMTVDTSSFTDEDGQPVMYAWASNKSPAGEEMEELVAQRVEALRASNPAMADQPIPVDLVTCSGSGLDPEISLPPPLTHCPTAAARGFRKKRYRRSLTSTPPLLPGIFGEPGSMSFRSTWLWTAS